jgi:hypothetical protein
MSDKLGLSFIHGPNTLTNENDWPIGDWKRIVYFEDLLLDDFWFMMPNIKQSNKYIKI